MKRIAIIVAVLLLTACATTPDVEGQYGWREPYPGVHPVRMGVIHFNWEGVW